MTRIITTTQVQQKIGDLAQNIETTSYIVTNRGEGKIIMLPYFDGCDENILEYMEDFEMYNNKNKLQKRYEEAHKSGRSKLVI